MELTRYSVIEDKNPREIVLLRGRGCAWKRCRFCDYHLDASRNEQENLSINRAALAQVTGRFGRLEAINSGSFAELEESTITEIERVCREKASAICTSKATGCSEKRSPRCARGLRRRA